MTDLNERNEREVKILTDFLHMLLMHMSVRCLLTATNAHEGR